MSKRVCGRVRYVKARTHWADFPSADSSRFRILFDMDSRPPIVKSVVKSANSGIESADSTANSAANPLRIGLWVGALSAWGYISGGIMS